MAGRCVTRGTDAGLVYYPTISRRKTRTEGREHAIVDAALPTCVYMPRSFALWRPGKYTGVSANSGERFTFVSRSFFFRRSRLLRNGMYVREQEREGPAAKSIERVRSKEWRTTQITRGLLWRNGVPDFSTGSEKGKIYFSFPPFHFLLWVSGRGGGVNRLYCAAWRKLRLRKVQHGFSIVQLTMLPWSGFLSSMGEFRRGYATAE